MENDVTRIRFNRNNGARLAKTTAVLVGLTAVASIAAALLGYTLRAVDAASDPMRERQTVSAQPAKGLAANSAPAAGMANRPELEFDYFPNHYVILQHRDDRVD